MNEDLHYELDCNDPPWVRFMDSLMRMAAWKVIGWGVLEIIIN